MKLRWIFALLLVAIGAWLVFGGTSARFVLAWRILDELHAPRADSWLRRSTPAPRVDSLTLRSGGRSFAADRYRPGSGHPRATAILVPGAIAEGKDDPRVAPFARLLARAGFTVLVPNLPSFRTLTVEPENLRELEAALDAVTTRRDLAPLGRAGVFGVSYAGGIALLAALDPARAARVSFVVAAGAYADLDSALTFLATGRTEIHGGAFHVEPSPYGQFVFLRTYERFMTDQADVALLDSMAERRLRDPRAPLADLGARLGPQGRLIYDLFETAPPARVPGMIARLPAELERRMAELSPARRDFSRLRADLFIVHARDDDTFPVSGAYQIARLARPYTHVHLAVLQELQHVDVEPWHRRTWAFLTRDLPEAWRFAWWWTALLAEH